MQPWSYGCTREVARHERSVRVARGDSRVRLQLLECLVNLPSASITPWLHNCNVYHFFYNIIKREKHYISIFVRLSHRSEFMYAAICPRVNKSCSMFYKNLPLSFSFAESAVLRLQVNCKTFFVVIVNSICLLALNIRVKTLRENYICNYKHQLKRL